MFKKVFLDHWIDWTIAIIIMVFIVVWGAIQRYSIEQDYSFTGEEIFYSIKFHHKTQQQVSIQSSEQTQMLEAARVFTSEHSEGFEFNLSIVKQVNNWALIKVIPVTSGVDQATVVMKKVNGKWGGYGIGTAFPNLEEVAPELFR